MGHPVRCRLLETYSQFQAPHLHQYPGKDRDYGYAVLRLSDDIPWKPRHLLQFGNYLILSVFFQWGVALHELEFEKIRSGEVRLKINARFSNASSARQAAKWPRTMLCSLCWQALWHPKCWQATCSQTWRVTYGRRPSYSADTLLGARPFTQEECENETRGQWYYRQLLGSSNFTGGRWLHILSGHLSYQIEHHLYPDIPAHRYPEMAEQVQAICRQHNLPYNTNRFSRQFLSVLKEWPVIPCRPVCREC